MRGVGPLADAGTRFVFALAHPNFYRRFPANFIFLFMGLLLSIFASHSESLDWPDKVKVHSLIVLGRRHIGGVCHIVET